MTKKQLIDLCVEQGDVLAKTEKNLTSFATQLSSLADSIEATEGEIERQEEMG